MRSQKKIFSIADRSLSSKVKIMYNIEGEKKMNLVENMNCLLENTRKEVPLIHNITNYVTVNDCANAVLAIGASPIMADDCLEVEDIVNISDALVLNIGTLNQRTVESMIMAGKKANQIGVPVVFDPVGAGASSFRNETVEKILNMIDISIIRANLSEMSFIAGLQVTTKGVDSSDEDASNDPAMVAKNVANKYHCITAITGAIDTISDGKRVCKLSNGVKLLSKVTGTGCMTSSLVGSFAGTCKKMNSNLFYEAAILGISTMSISGEISASKNTHLGTGSFHMGIIDEISQLSSSTLDEKINYQEEK